MKYYDIASAENELNNLYSLPQSLRLKNIANIDKVLGQIDKFRITMFNNPELSQTPIPMNFMYLFIKSISSSISEYLVMA